MFPFACCAGLTETAGLDDDGRSLCNDARRPAMCVAFGQKLCRFRLHRLWACTQIVVTYNLPENNLIWHSAFSGLGIIV